MGRLRLGRPLRRLSARRDLPLRGLPLKGSALRMLPLRRLRWPLLRTPLGLLRRSCRTLRRSASPGHLRCGSQRPPRPRLRRRRSILPRRLGSLRLLRWLRWRRTLGPGRNGLGRPVDIERRLAGGRSLPVRPGTAVGPKCEIGTVARHHHRNVGHSLRPQLDDPRLKLGIDAPEQWADIEIEQRAVGIHYAASLRPRRQRIERALLERLHHIWARA